jgi:hypothetical protein
VSKRDIDTSEGIAPRADADTAEAKLRYFLEAWEMNGVGRTIATVQDSPGTVVTITVDDLKAAAGASNERADAEKDAALLEVIEHTIATLKRQIDLIAERAPGNFLDKVPVVRSLRAHQSRLERAILAAKEKK